MNPDEGPSSFRVELSPLTEMPHSVTTFLDLVSLKLYDGTAFVAGDEEVIEGGAPSTAETEQSIKLFERYAKFGYRRSPLGFNEYSEKSPHDIFTLSFTGNPVAGPALAVNMQNNTESRGPADDGVSPEPAFGTIVQGQDTLRRMLTAPRAADGYRFALNVRIETVRLVIPEAAVLAEGNGDEL